MRFRVFPCDLEGSGCYRTIYPYGMIEQNTSHEVIMAAERVDDRILLPIPECMIGYGEKSVSDELEEEMFMDSDIYVFQRPVEKLYPGVIMKLKYAGKKVVVDLDDYMHGLSPIGPKASMSRLKKRASSEALTLCIRMADVITVSTERLRQEYSKMNPNTVVLRNKLRKQDFEHITPSWSQDRDKVRVGWMGLMRYRANDLSILKPWLNKFLKRHPEVLFVNVGGTQAMDYLCIPKDRRETYPSAVFPTHFDATSEIDIGLVPLTKNSFNESKSYLKGMEYGAVGAMVIASRTEEYKRWVDVGANGLLASTAEEWMDVLEYALEDDNWRLMAEDNWIKANNNLINDHWDDWLSLYEAKVAA